MADLLRFQSRVPLCTFQATSSLKINIFARPARTPRLSILPPSPPLSSILLAEDVPPAKARIELSFWRKDLLEKDLLERGIGSNLLTRDDDFESSFFFSSLSLSKRRLFHEIRRGPVFRRALVGAEREGGGEFVYSAQTNRPNASPAERYYKVMERH